MYLKMINTDALPSKKAWVLFDDNGQMLPGQQACTIAQKVLEPTTVTVTFVVDGDKIRIDG